jgi:hypothetical protein
MHFFNRASALLETSVVSIQQVHKIGVQMGGISGYNKKRGQTPQSGTISSVSTLEATARVSVASISERPGSKDSDDASKKKELVLYWAYFLADK